MYDQLMQRLRKPGGGLGTLSVASAAVLAVVGVVGAVSMIVSIIAGSDFWSDSNGVKALTLVFFLVMLLGAAGFVLEDEHVWAGALLGVLGGAALALVLFWTVLAIVVGIAVAVIAVFRAREMHHPAGPTTHPAH